MSNLRIRDLEKCEKPREKIKNNGSDSLSDVELLALILGTGSKEKPVLGLARDLLTKFDGLAGIANAGIEELIDFEGIGLAKACSLKATLEISKRLLHPAINTNIKIRSPQDVFTLVSKDLCFTLTEKLILISIDSRGRYISKDIITMGTVNETIINAREIYQKSFSRNASSVILAHNHPSGDTTPSPEDIEATKIIGETGRLIGIPLLDHLIVSQNSFTSLKQLGLLKKQEEGGDKNETE
jgi:DNA repair protein RadC